MQVSCFNTHVNNLTPITENNECVGARPYLPTTCHARVCDGGGSTRVTCVKRNGL